jgi:hypothetical protein
MTAMKALTPHMQPHTISPRDWRGFIEVDATSGDIQDVDDAICDFLGPGDIPWIP